MNATFLLVTAMISSASAAVVTPTFYDRYDYGGCLSGITNVAAADINGDGVPDLVCSGLASVTTLLGNGDGTFRSGPASKLGVLGVSYLVLLDLNGDGIMDVIAAAILGPVGPSGFVVSLGNGDGTFQPSVFYQTGNDRFGYFIATGDFNGDGIIDFVSEAESGIWYVYR